MRLLRRTPRRKNPGTGMELAGALSVASQMALLCPPGFDELVRRELAAEAGGARPDGRPHGATR
ncbi:MAG TPA: hypothetical protein VG898_09040 [Solirubrobacterales bacterium]|nr:hypothetical protein [Solirubrobacterales bacterium]